MFPSLKTKDTVKTNNRVELCDCLATTVLSEDSFFKNTYIVEIERGCPKKCKFCQTSYLNHPVRFIDYKKIIQSLDFGLKYTNKIALLGAAICAHPKIDEICDYIINRVDGGEEIEMSVSSLRADCVSEKTVQALVKCGQRSATIAVEAGSARESNPAEGIEPVQANLQPRSAGLSPPSAVFPAASVKGRHFCVISA